MHVGTHADLKGSNMLRNLLKSRQFSYDYIKYKVQVTFLQSSCEHTNSYTEGRRFKHHSLTHTRTHTRARARARTHTHTHTDVK